MDHTDDRIKDHRERAERFLADAGLLHESGRHESSLNRSYFAAHAAAKALIMAAGKEAAGHRELELELAALDPPAFMTETIRLLRQRREEADYGSVSPGEPGTRWEELSQDSLRRAGEFLAAAALLIKKYLA